MPISPISWRGLPVLNGTRSDMSKSLTDDALRLFTEDHRVGLEEMLLRHQNNNRSQMVPVGSIPNRMEKIAETYIRVDK